ncbi:hypothetical protein [Streptomyces chartreusis]|uniref:hypothetical protein n=1 Tax=Streptomyces chartreusis TaxID=1969 RepID=UPI003863B8A0|nr:hypothetical protein OG938_47885 [Streptomyces chartreusis]
MPHPCTVTPYSPTWHAAQEADERAWLDQWARLHLIPATHPERAPQAPARALTAAGRH